MRFLQAPLLYPLSVSPIVNGIVVLNENGSVKEILNPAVTDILPPEVEHFEGILCPGFVNAHCHLELSHLKGKFTQKKTLPHFISEVIALRAAPDEIIVDAMQKADTEMFNNGIVAAGDISNTLLSATVKERSRIFYHTFIELFDINPEKAQVVFNKGCEMEKVFSRAGLHSSLSPHAPYTVSERLFSLINEYSRNKNSPVSIHSGETAGENEMFISASGPLFSKLNELTGAFNNWPAPQTSSMKFILRNLKSVSRIQLVHNTFTSEEDISTGKKYNAGDNSSSPEIFFCLCPNANLFIEDRLPGIAYFIREKCKITTGTDSYASNHSLSVLDELKTISTHFPEVTFDEMIRWSTINGAEFLGIHATTGSLEKGKLPGVINITGINVNKPVINENSLVKRVG